MSARKAIYAALKFYREIRKDAKQLRTQPRVIKILSNFCRAIRSSCRHRRSTTRTSLTARVQSPFVYHPSMKCIFLYIKIYTKSDIIFYLKIIVFNIKYLRL